MSNLPETQEPLAVAARSHRRLALALQRVGIGLGGDSPASCADLDPLGEPVVRFGPLAAQAADRLSDVLEAVGALARAVGGRASDDHVEGATPC